MFIDYILKDTKTKEDLDNIIELYGINYQDQEGNGFLHYFSKTGKIDLLSHLVKKEKFNVNLKNNFGRTALYEALNEDTVEFLLKYRIDHRSLDYEKKRAEEVNQFVNFIMKKKCNETKKKIMNTFMGQMPGLYKPE